MNPDTQYSLNMTFLALCVWREARGEIYTAKLAVAYVALTRVAKGGWWGDSLMSVLFKPEQFSSLTHAGDPNLIQWPKPYDPFWEDSVQASVAAISKTVPNPAPEADSYFSGTVEPYWAAKSTFIASVGAFKFFKTS